MPVKLFILGRPGSGKSTAARRIMKIVENRKGVYVRINDFNILKGMYEKEKKLNHFLYFKPIDNDGFDVVNFEVLDITLNEVKSLATRYAKSGNHDLVIIEFARADYRLALKKFDSSFLSDAYFLFLNADLTTCIKRVHERTAHPVTPDDNFVSDDMIRNYYYLDNRPYMTTKFTADYDLDSRHLKIFENTGSLEDFNGMVENFIEFIFDQEALKARQTDPIQQIPFFVSDTELAK